MNGEPMAECNDDAPGCWAAKPENIAPGEKGMVDDEYLEEESRLLGAFDSVDETECCC